MSICGVTSRFLIFMNGILRFPVWEVVSGMVHCEYCPRESFARENSTFPMEKSRPRGLVSRSFAWKFPGMRMKSWKLSPA